MSDFFHNPFMAFSAGFGLGPIPLGFARKRLYPPVMRYPNGRVKFAPYGLRKVETILLENGFTESEVAVVHPDNLDEFIGPRTKVVGISSMDPTGMGYVSKTYSSIIGGGEPMNSLEFRKLVSNPLIRKFKPKVIVGGFGAWQLERKHITDKYGIDSVFIGGRPETITKIFRKAVNNEKLSRIIRDDDLGSQWDYKKMPACKHAAIHGTVEISKGCGRNCQFCTPTVQHKVDVSLEKIMQEVDMTVREGSEHITLVTEDLFLYGSKNDGFEPCKEAVINLIKSVANHSGVKQIQASHISLAPVVNNPKMITELTNVLIEHNWYSFGKGKIITAETGIETGSSRLMKKYMAGKMLPYKPEQWQEIVTSAFGILNDNSWCPLATLIIGLPDENEEDVLETLELIDKLKGYKAFYVPLFFVPLENCVLMNNRGAELDSLSKARWDLFIRCWEYNIRLWKPTFLENRIKNPILYKTVNNLLIPYFAAIMGFYYGFTRGKQLKHAFWSLGVTQSLTKKTK